MFTKLKLIVQAVKAILSKKRGEFIFMVKLHGEGAELFREWLEIDPYWKHRKTIRTREEILNEAFSWIVSWGMNVLERDILTEDEEGGTAYI